MLSSFIENKMWIIINMRLKFFIRGVINDFSTSWDIFATADGVKMFLRYYLHPEFILGMTNYNNSWIFVV